MSLRARVCGWLIASSIAVAVPAHAAVFLSINIAPPVLPVYVQPRAEFGV